MDEQTERSSAGIKTQPLIPPTEPLTQAKIPTETLSPTVAPETLQPQSPQEAHSEWLNKATSKLMYGASLLQTGVAAYYTGHSGLLSAPYDIAEHLSRNGITPETLQQISYIVTPEQGKALLAAIFAGALYAAGRNISKKIGKP